MGVAAAVAMVLIASWSTNSQWGRGRSPPMEFDASASDDGEDDILQAVEDKAADVEDSQDEVPAELEQQSTDEDSQSSSGAEDDSETIMLPPGPTEVHIVFVMSCSQRNRLLQQTVVQTSAASVGQRGPMTQVITGCSDDERELAMQEPVLYHDFRRHFAPSYSPHPVPGVEDHFDPYNQAFGLRHYLHHVVFPTNDTVFALIEGDFVFFRKLEVNTGDSVQDYYHGSRDPAKVSDTVRDGAALAQDWMDIDGAGWFAKDKRDDLAKICSNEPCNTVSEEEALEDYAAIGPPYLITRRDLSKMIDDYCDFVVEGRKRDQQDWNALARAYSAAAANSQIRHMKLSNLGVTSPPFSKDGHEYWEFVDADFSNPCEDPFEVAMPENPPVAIHYSQWLFDFYSGFVPANISSCASGMLRVPPASDWTEINTTVRDSLREFRRHEVWAKCSLFKVMNRALKRIKEHQCPNGFNAYQDIEPYKPVTN